MTSSDDPEANLTPLRGALRAANGADLILTPEVTNCVSLDRARQGDVLRTEAEDPTLVLVRVEAARSGTPVLIGSLALKGGVDGRFVNRSILVDGAGAIAARYDKIHMFDVEVGAGESYRESSGYAPGDRAVIADVAGVKLG
ncbi:MAG: nitrilase-related carbon-nitrogen hydrolase, partial [Shimia sp.]